MGAVPVDFKLLLVTDRKICRDEPLARKVDEALLCGIQAVQLREKDLSSRELLGMAQEFRELTERHNAKLFINDRLDIALLSRADGVQIPEEGAPVPAVRAFRNGDSPLKRGQSPFLIGRSVHSLEGAKSAQLSGADFITYSPIYETLSKEGILKPKGVESLREVALAVKIPVFALGGITPDRAAACRKAGAHGVAVISSILKSPDLPTTMEQFRRALGSL